jgi:hypothetical protein
VSRERAKASASLRSVLVFAWSSIRRIVEYLRA